MCAQVPFIRLSHDASSNDSAVSYGSTASIILTTTTANAPTAVLLTALAWLCLHTTTSDEPSLRSERDDASGRHPNAKPISAASSGLGLSVF